MKGAGLRSRLPRWWQRRQENDAPRAAALLGWRLEKRGDVAGAKAAYQRAIDSGDADVAPGAAFFLGQMLEKQGDEAGARAAYERAVEGGDAEAAAWSAFLLGRMLEKQGDVAGAKAVYQRAIDSAHADISDRAMKDIVIRVEWTTDDLRPARRGEIIKLAILLREDGHSVTIDERHPGTGGAFAIGEIETVAIYIATSAGAGLIGAIVTDVYNRAKKWTREQWKQKKKAYSRVTRLHSSQSFYLYGPDGKAILYWKISYEGEYEEVYQEIRPQSDDKSNHDN